MVNLACIIPSNLTCIVLVWSHIIQLSIKSLASNKVFLQKTRQEVKADDDICLAVFVTKQAMCGKLRFFYGTSGLFTIDIKIPVIPDRK